MLFNVRFMLFGMSYPNKKLSFILKVIKVWLPIDGREGEQPIINLSFVIKHLIFVSMSLYVMAILKIESFFLCVVFSISVHIRKYDRNKANYFRRERQFKNIKFRCCNRREQFIFRYLHWDSWISFSSPINLCISSKF